MSANANDDDDEYYIIDNILDKRYRQGKPQYLIKWEGCDQCTWEPLENLENAYSTVIEFEEVLSVKSCSENEIEMVGVEPIGDEGKIIVLVKTKVADRIFRFDSKEIAEIWPDAYIDFLEKHIKFYSKPPTR